MELPGSNYLYTLAMLGLGFASVSALIMILRQIMGGAMSKFDVMVTRNFIIVGFTVAIDSMLPPLVDLLPPARPVVWSVASVVAAIPVAWAAATYPSQRRAITGVRPPLFVLFFDAGLWFVVAALLANAAIPAVKGVGLFAVAMTTYLALTMWVFVRRIGTLLRGAQASSDWDPTVA
jgi:hypothetical protein